MFISEVLHPMLKLEAFSSELPFSADEALSEEVAKKAACTFRMIYYAIGSEAFAQTLHRLITENEFKSISIDTFYETLQEASEGQLESETEIDLREVIESFVGRKTIVMLAIGRQSENILTVIKTPTEFPFNYITSSMENPSGFKWLSNSSIEFVTIPSLKDGDWFVVNVDQLGFYRVNYDDNNWKAIINAIRKNSQIFSSRTKAQLIDDAMTMAIDGYLSTSIVLDLLMELRVETDFLPWNAAMKNLLHLNNLLSSSEVHQEFQNFSLELSENFMLHIGFEDDLELEKTSDKLSRIEMIDFACRMGSEECLSNMLSKLESHIDGEKLPVNLQSSVFCYGLMASALSSEGFKFMQALLDEMQASDNTEYRLRIISSLGCFGDVEALRDLLKQTLNSTDVRYLSGEKFQVIQSVFSETFEGVEATMEFMTQYYNEAVQWSQTSNLIEILIKNLPKRIFNEELLNKFKVMLEAFQVSSEQSAQAVQIAQANIDWLKSEAAEAIISQFINQRVTTEAETETSTTILQTTTDPSTTITTTQAACNVMLSTVLGLLCAIMRLVM